MVTNIQNTIKNRKSVGVEVRLLGGAGWSKGASPSSPFTLVGKNIWRSVRNSEDNTESKKKKI